jgi:hypothetical protein
MTTSGIDGLGRSATHLGIVAVVGGVAAWRLSQTRNRRRARQAAEAPIPGGAGRRAGRVARKLRKPRGPVRRTGPQRVAVLLRVGDVDQAGPVGV